MEMNQTELAESLGVSKQHVSRAIGGETGKLPPIWTKILEKLDLELVVKQKAK